MRKIILAAALMLSAPTMACDNDQRGDDLCALEGSSGYQPTTEEIVSCRAWFARPRSQLSDVPCPRESHDS